MKFLRNVRKISIRQQHQNHSNAMRMKNILIAVLVADKCVPTLENKLSVLRKGYALGIYFHF